jgi:hypothetical protein
MKRRRHRGSLRLTIVLFLVAAAAPIGAGARAGAATPARAGCAGSFLPVGLRPETTAAGREQVYVELCVPAVPVATVQVLVHGMTYDHPFSRTVDIDSNAFVVHQVIQALRRGAIPGPAGDRPVFSRVALVAHSYGSWTAWFEATRYHDEDGVILTGVTHRPNFPWSAVVVFPNLHPAVTDPAFADRGWDPGYLTSRPGSRYDLFYAPADADPAVVALDEATKQTVTSAEIDTFPRILRTPLDIRAPTLLVNGDRDGLFCGRPPVSTDCSTPEALIAAERPYLGSRVPSLEAIIVPGGGHDLNLMRNSAVLFSGALAWTDRHIGRG